MADGGDLAGVARLGQAFQLPSQAPYVNGRNESEMHLPNAVAP